MQDEVSEMDETAAAASAASAAAAASAAEENNNTTAATAVDVPEQQEPGGLMQASSAASSAVFAVCDALLSEAFTQSVAQPWHATGGDHDAPRDRVRAWVADLIAQRRPHADEEWRGRLTEVAARVERMLYSSAASLDE